MPQSLVKNYLHLVFSTKHRQHFITDEIQPELCSYLGGIFIAYQSTPIRIGGHTNHIHALFLLHKSMTLIKIVEEVKSHSSKWIKTKRAGFQNFYWQNGYGAFSVNPTEIDRVTAYIDSQKEHHRKMTFEDEYRGFLKKYNVEYDERYVWD